VSLSTQFLGAVIGFLYGTFFEWVLHKHIMHTPKRLSYAYTAHDQVHHKVFGYKKTYHLQRKEDQHLVTFAKWNYPVLLLLNLPVMFGIQWLIGLPIIWGMIISMTFYYMAYEYFHFCYHVPKNRWFEKLAIYQRVKEHHLLHHKYKLQNLNVVFPVADFVLGTIITRENPRDNDVLDPAHRKSSEVL